MQCVELPEAQLIIFFQIVKYNHLFEDYSQDIEDVELIPDSEDTHPDSPLEDIVSVTLRRENSIRRSQCGSR